MSESDHYPWKVYYACENAGTYSLDKRKAGPHTCGMYSYGNGAGARWGAAMRPHKCEHCGGAIVTAGTRKGLQALLARQRSK